MCGDYSFDLSDCKKYSTMKIQNVCLLLFISFLSCGQNPECNQLTTGGKRKAPKDVCVPDGYNIRVIFECGDGVEKSAVANTYPPKPKPHSQPANPALMLRNRVKALEDAIKQKYNVEIVVKKIIIDESDEILEL